jgi:hypothetical protein
LRRRKLKFAGGALVGATLTASLVLVSGSPAQSEETEIATFTLREPFGVSHPSQVVSFDLDKTFDPGLSYMIGPQGEEVLYQRLSDGAVAVQSGLAPFESRSWKLMSGRPPSKLPGGLTLHTETEYYEITNGFTGVRVLRADGIRDRRLAPIQGILLRHGVWSATGPNYVRQGQWAGSKFWTEPLVADSVETKLIEWGPLLATVEVSYTYDRPDLRYGGKVVIPAGRGYYRSRITLRAGQPSVLIEDDTDMDLQYYLSFYKEIQPDRNRWKARGPESERPLRCDIESYPFYLTRMTGNRYFFKWISPWDPWADDAGYYSLIHNSGAGPDGPIVAIYAGRASRAIGSHASGPAPFCVPESIAGERQGGIAMQINRVSPDARVNPRVRMQWAIYVGTKGADLAVAEEYSNIYRQMNLDGGFNLDKISRFQLEYEDPPAGYRPMFLDADTLNSIIDRVRSDPAYAKWLGSAEPMVGPLLKIWTDPSGAAAIEAASEIIAYAGKFLDALVNRGGIYDREFHYWHGGLGMTRRSVVIGELLRSNQLSEPMRSRLKAAAALFAALLLDEDFVPLSGVAGVNLGTPNMPMQQVQYRHQYILLLPNHPAVGERVNEVLRSVARGLAADLNEYGAQRAATGYTGASMAPLLTSALQLRAQGFEDLFQTEPRLAKFARFYMDMLTPREPRFGGLRKVVSLGDSATSRSVLFGLLATGMKTADPELSGQLMQAWVDNGRPHDFFNGSTVVKIDDRIPAVPYQLTSAHYPGYASILRHGSGSRNETALWFINGDFYFDHRHNDNGTISIYALESPLSIDWGSIGYPRTPGAYMHSGVVPEESLSKAWHADDLDFSSPSNFVWKAESLEGFYSFDLSTSSTAKFHSRDGRTWVRTVRILAPNGDYPAIVISDRMGGASGANIFTLNLMAQGLVMSTVGSFDPPLRTFDAYGSLKQMPSATGPVRIPAGVNRFNFEGQWNIDWDLFQFSDEPQEVVIGNWAHRWAPAKEQEEFRRAHGRAFEERQHIFRLKGSTAFDTLILPYWKGAARRGLRVARQGGVTIVSAANEELRYSEVFYSYWSPDRRALATFGLESMSFDGIEISGGPTEVVLSGGRVVISAHGPAGTRRIKLPAALAPAAPLSYEEGAYRLPYEGGGPVRVELSPTR